MLCLLLIFPTHSFITEAQTIILTPKWTAQAQFAGYYAAEKMGFYKEAGLDVRIEHPAISESSFSILEEGRTHVAVMNLSFALTARANGSRIINVMQTSQKNSLMLVSRIPLKDITSLQHKKIAVWNHLSQELLDRLTRHYKLNVEWIRFNSGIDLFLSGAADICLIGSYNEYPQLIECGLKTDTVHFYRFSDYGYDLPEDGLYVTEEFYRDHPEEVNRLVQASMRGWKWANEHREQALDIVMEMVRRNNIGTNRYHQRLMLEEVLQLQKDKLSDDRTYRLSRERFDYSSSILLNDNEKNAIRFTDFVK